MLPFACKGRHALLPFAHCQNFVKDDSQWVGFRPKLAKWLCLCENYPYRMSFLVLVIADRAQKEQVNQLRRKHPSIQEYGLVHYGKGGGGKAIVPKTLDTMEAAAAETKAAEARAAAAATIQARTLPLQALRPQQHAPKAITLYIFIYASAAREGQGEDVGQPQRNKRGRHDTTMTEIETAGGVYFTCTLPAPGLRPQPPRRTFS